MLTRRGFAQMAALSGLAAFQTARAAPLTVPDKQLRFTVLRNGSTIGYHQLIFDAQGNDLVVTIDAQMRVGFGPITFFRYRHQGVERWSGGRFMSLQTKTDNDGQALRVSAVRTDSGIKVEATDSPTHMLPGDALPLTHWNVASMSGPLFNPQDGKLLHEVSRCEGQDLVPLADGKRVEATRYSLNGKVPMDDWYDRSLVWTALQAEVKDGSLLRYLRDA